MQVLDGQKPVTLGHGSFAHPLFVIRVPVLVVGRQIAANNEMIFELLQVLLFFVHARLCHHAPSNASKHIEWTGSCRQVACHGVNKSRPGQLLLERSHASKLFGEHPPSCTEASCIFDDGKAPHNLCLHRCGTISSRKEEVPRAPGIVRCISAASRTSLLQQPGKIRGFDRSWEEVACGLLSQHLDNIVQGHVLEVVVAECRPELRHVQHVDEERVHIVVAKDIYKEPDLV
mmetsp:Transcript_96131/g.228968  ORF Transcript_96131/g.228968 Transcript_96131/m.228968 type:complete len:231 (+) Transcript_96131:1074-1766(+)